MKKYISLVTILSLSIIFTGCEDNGVKVLEDDFKNTKIGTIEKQKLVTKLPPKKVVKVEPKPKPKKKVNLTVQQKKQRFKDILVPIATEVYKILDAQYHSVKKDMANGTNREFIEKLKVQYKAKTDEKLLHALKPHPISIVLAQGAIESAWLTSRFTKSANNIFGVWSFNKNEPRIAANATRGTKKIYLKKYKTYRAAVLDYYKNLGKNWAYEKFRERRTQTNDPYELVEYLGSYSEKKEVYTNTLKKMIEYNKFYEYDIK